jgi:hypothetical protein
MPQESTRAESGHGPLSSIISLGRRMSKPETWTWLLVAFGVLFRVMEYSADRPLYRDEASLFRNLVGRGVLDFVTPLTEDQLAPPGFLVVERAVVRLPFRRIWAARSIPFICGLASMFLMPVVARRYLSARAVPIAVGLFALDDWIIYYTTELKQYSSDTTLTLIALLLASVPTEKSQRRLFALTGFGLVGVWFSHPLALVLGAVGTYLAASAVIRRDWKRVRDYVAMSALWAFSFAICYYVSHHILSKDRFIWDWWAFAFLPIPPRSLADLERMFWQVLNIFNNPAWVLTPLGVLVSAFLALGLYLVGAISLGLRWRGGAYLLIAPVVFALFASALHQYPFHGRLLLFLVPTIHLLVAEGAVALARPRGVLLTIVLGVFLLSQPTRVVIWNELVMKRNHDGYDSHGDLAPDLLDHLERRAIHNPSALPLP